jgi:hypothetical protein
MTALGSDATWEMEKAAAKMPGRISKRAGAWALLILAALMAMVVLFLPPVPQPNTYHQFADQRSHFGVPNFADVASNLPFAVVGVWGLVFLLRVKSKQAAAHFLDPRERWPYLLVLVGLLGTAAGSSYYHLRPDNSRLLWDRLPMTIVFMSIVGAVIAERINLRAGLWLLPVLNLIGVGSVFQWYASELHGSGDLRLYAAVQAYSALVLLIALLFPSSYTRRWDLLVVLSFYVLAKVFELLDRPIFNASRVVSGHTLKHLSAAFAGYWILRMLQKRERLPRDMKISQPQPKLAAGFRR